MLSDMFQLQKAEVAETPRVRIGDAESTRTAASPSLDCEDCMLYRTATMGAAYLAVDSPHISEAVQSTSWWASWFAQASRSERLVKQPCTVSNALAMQC